MMISEYELIHQIAKETFRGTAGYNEALELIVRYGFKNKSDNGDL